MKAVANVVANVDTSIIASEGERPEHHGDRRRFLIWALMLGAVKPERVVERVVAEIEARTS